MNKNKQFIKQRVREGYAKIAKHGGSCCQGASCCGGVNLSQDISKSIGYTEKEINMVPQGANLGLGCGNPVAIASIKEGDVVVDLGSGAGFDAFLAAKKVGKKGRVIGIDMTPEMIKKAKANAKKGGYTNVEFKLSEIEKLPLDDNYADIIISNCVINLSTDKKAVFREAFRVLKEGGKLMVSDLVLIKDLPKNVKESVAAYVGCLAGAIKKEEYLEHIKSAGFQDIRIISQTNYPIEAMANDATAKAVMDDLSLKEKDLKNIVDAVVSVKIHAIKSNNKGVGDEN
jgi:ubiquinone/menaquinone biosynthesis C-methylase UbiE